MQPNFWTNRVSSTSAAVLANQMEQLSVKNNNDSTDRSATNNDQDSTKNLVPAVSENGAATTTSSNSEGASRHVDNPQGGMKFTGSEHGTGIAEPGSVVTASHSEDGKQDFTNQPRSNSERHLMKVPPTKKDGRKLFVGGIPANVSDDDFRSFFEQFGEVIDSVVMYDRDTHRSRGFGFVTFENLATADNVLAQARQQNNKLNIHGKDCEVKAAEPKASTHDSHFQGHSYRDKRKGHDNRSAFAKVDQNRGLPNDVPIQAYGGYAPGPYYAAGMAAYQQQYYSNMVASNNAYAHAQGGSFPSSQPPYEQEVPSFPPQSQAPIYPGYQYSHMYYQQQQQQYPPYGGGGYTMGYGGGDQEPPLQDRAYGAPVGNPFPGQNYGYQNTFSPVGGGGTPPPPPEPLPPQQMVPGFVTVSPFQAAASYEMAPFGSDQSGSDIQGDEARQYQE